MKFLDGFIIKALSVVSDPEKIMNARVTWRAFIRLQKFLQCGIILPRLDIGYSKIQVNPCLFIVPGCSQTTRNKNKQGQSEYTYYYSLLFHDFSIL